METDLHVRMHARDRFMAGKVEQKYRRDYPARLCSRGNAT
jgi:hypothetical protein